MMNGVQPFLCVASSVSASDLSSILTTSVCPFCAAMYSGVAPSCPGSRSMFTPHLRAASTPATLPSAAALYSCLSLPIPGMMRALRASCLIFQRAGESAPSDFPATYWRDDMERIHETAQHAETTTDCRVTDVARREVCCVLCRPVSHVDVHACRVHVPGPVSFLPLGAQVQNQLDTFLLSGRVLEPHAEWVHLARTLGRAQHALAGREVVDGLCAVALRAGAVRLVQQHDVGDRFVRLGLRARTHACGSITAYMAPNACFLVRELEGLKANY